jgi:hypothetical protein
MASRRGPAGSCSLARRFGSVRGLERRSSARRFRPLHARNPSIPALRAPNRTPREPRCASGRMAARRGDGDVLGSGTARSLDAADDGPRRNPQGRASLVACLCRSGLAHWSPMRCALASWPATRSAPSRPRGVLLGALKIHSLSPTIRPLHARFRPSKSATSVREKRARSASGWRGETPRATGG